MNSDDATPSSMLGFTKRAADAKRLVYCLSCQPTWFPNGNIQGVSVMRSDFTLFHLPTVSAALASILYLSGNSIAYADTSAPNVTILHCPALIDTVSGKLLGKTSVVIEGERVQKLAPDFISQEGATVVELAGQTCLPGLIDTHTEGDLGVALDRVRPAHAAGRVHHHPQSR
jgi:hypothetical protein